MKSPGVFILSFLLLTLSGGVWWAWHHGVAPLDSSNQSATSATGSTPRGSAHSVEFTHDKAAVFQRAFWRRPERDDRIIAAERREWLDDTSVVRKWQWFLAVDPSPVLSHWLIDDNPFEVSVVAMGSSPPVFEGAPEWFPTQSELAAFMQYSTSGSRFSIFIDPKSGRLFAADSGSGFSTALR
jgi:hypothetical protein